MNAVDRLLQRHRMKKAAGYLRRGDRVLDIGCADGALARVFPALGSYVGIDPDCESGPIGPSARLLRGVFPEGLGDEPRFDALVMLAVLEHVPLRAQPAFVATCFAMLEPGGRAIVTVPSPLVDRILDVLIALRIAHGMKEEEHFGFDVGQTEPLFVGAGFATLAHERFQLGLNNLFVFKKP